MVYFNGCKLSKKGKTNYLVNYCPTLRKSGHLPGHNLYIVKGYLCARSKGYSFHEHLVAIGTCDFVKCSDEICLVPPKSKNIGIGLLEK